MPDDLTTAPESEQQTSADNDPATIDTSSIPDALPTEDVRGLKSALEKLKNQVAELKALGPKAAIVDQITQQGIDPSEIPAKLEAIQQQQKSEELLNQRLAEAEAKAKADREQLSQQYQGEISKLIQQINAQTKRQQLESVLAKAGGSAADYGDFSAIASRYIEFGDNQQITGFKSPEGQTLYVDDEKQVGKVRVATVEDFILKAKSGDYGKALQSILPAINQASGAGITSNNTTSPNGPLVLTQAQIDRMGEMSTEELKTLRKRGYVIVN